MKAGEKGRSGKRGYKGEEREEKKRERRQGREMPKQMFLHSSCLLQPERHRPRQNFGLYFLFNSFT